MRESEWHKVRGTVQLWCIYHVHIPKVHVMYHVVQVYHTVLMFVQNSKSTMEHGTHGQGVAHTQGCYKIVDNIVILQK